MSLRGFLAPGTCDGNLEAARAASDVAASLDADAVSSHLLGVVLGIRVLARTGTKRKVLEKVAQSALGLLASAPRHARRSRAP